MKFYILAEKKMAAQDFSKALGGQTGTRNGHDYVIGHAAGHLLKLRKPEDLVPKERSDFYHKWSFAHLPWVMSDFTWKLMYMVNKKGETTKEIIDRIATESAECDAFVIAGDDDPSGEGDLIQWDIIDWIGWNKPVYRMHFPDSGVKEVQHAFDTMEIVDRTDKAYVRSRNRRIWDYISMQLTEALNVKLGEYGIKIKSKIKGKGGRQKFVNLRAGRLKSMILKFIGDRLAERKNFKKKSYFENRYYEENSGLVFSRKYTDGDEWRYDTPEETQNEMLSQNDVIGEVKAVAKEKTPEELPLGDDLVALIDKGFDPEQIVRSAQKLKDEGFISYHRTNDRHILANQFEELVELKDALIAWFGLESQAEKINCLTPRKPYAADSIDGHGGIRVLKVVQPVEFKMNHNETELAIYDLVAKRSLMIMCENKKYISYRLRLKNNPNFEATCKKVTNFGFDEVFGKVNSKSDLDGEMLEGKTVILTIEEGSNTMPAKLNIDRLLELLKKKNIGTGASRLQAIPEAMSAGSELIEYKNGELILSPAGIISYLMSQNLLISDWHTTQKLNEFLDSGNKTIEQVYESVMELVNHDLSVIKGLTGVQELVVNHVDANMLFIPTEKISIDLPDGREVKLPKQYAWSNGKEHTFTNEELEQLSNLEEITFAMTPEVNIKAKIGEGNVNGRDYFGLITEMVPNADNIYFGEKDDFPYQIRKKLTDDRVITTDELSQLLAGQTLKIDNLMKKDKSGTYSAYFVLELEEKSEGKKYWILNRYFTDPNKMVKVVFKKKNYSLDPYFSPLGRKFTSEELEMLSAGKALEFYDLVSKSTKKNYNAKVKFMIDSQYHDLKVNMTFIKK